MKKLLILTTILLSVLLTSLTYSQTPTYRWGKPMGPQAPEIAVLPFSDTDVSNQPLHKPKMRPIRKVTWPVCEPMLPPTPILPAPTWPMYATVDAAILWSKAAISFHNDQLGLTGITPVGQFAIAIIDPKAFKLRYSITTQQVQTDNLTPTTALMIGAAQVVAAAAAVGQPAPVAGAAAAGTPIKVDWTVGPNHRLDLVCLGISPVPRSFWLSPAFVANWIDFKITGTTLTPIAITGSETFNAFFWGGGLEAVYSQPSSRISVLAAASDKYLIADCNLAYAVGTNLDISVGWQGKQIKLERDTTVRLTAPTLGITCRF